MTLQKPATKTNSVYVQISTRKGKSITKSFAVYGGTVETVEKKIRSCFEEGKK